MVKKIPSLILAAAAAFYGTLSAFALDAKVVSVKGKVEIQEAGMWVALDEGDVVEKGTVISTGFNSEVVLSVKESNFTLGPLTRITVEDLTSSGDKDSTQLFIDSGSISVSVDSSEGRRTGFKVRSPVATASVRGTAFNLSSSGKISVNQGLVSFGPSESSKPEVAPDAEAAPAPEVKVEAAAASASSDSGDASAAEAPAEPKSEKAAAKAEKAAAKAAAKAEKAAAKKHDNAFASTDDVGGFTGVPVAAGQTSKTNTVTGGQSSPRSELAAASTGAAASATVPETLKAIQNTAAGALPSLTSVSSDTVIPAASTKGSVKITVSFAD